MFENKDECSEVVSQGCRTYITKRIETGEDCMKKVAIVGVEGSGKTVLMAAMGDKYESPDADGVFLKPVNRETYSYYTKEMAKLRSGKWPLATESSVLELEWMLMRKSGSNSAQAQLGRLSFLDFGGEVYRFAFGDKSQAELDGLGLDEQRKNAIERLKAHVENADVFMGQRRGTRMTSTERLSGNATVSITCQRSARLRTFRRRISRTPLCRPITS